MTPCTVPQALAAPRTGLSPGGGLESTAITPGGTSSFLQGPTLLPRGMTAPRISSKNTRASAPVRINQNLLQILLPQDEGDRKVSRPRFCG